MIYIQADLKKGTAGCLKTDLPSLFL